MANFTQNLDIPNLPNVPLSDISIKAEQNEIVSTSESGRTKKRKRFTYSRKIIKVTTPILTVDEAKQLQDLIDEKETTSSWFFTDIRPQEKFILSISPRNNNSVNFNTNDYKKDTFLPLQKLTLISSTGEKETVVVQSIDTLNGVIIFTQNITLDTLSLTTLEGYANYRVFFEKIPTLTKSADISGFYRPVTFDLKETLGV